MYKLLLSSVVILPIFSITAMAADIDRVIEEPITIIQAPNLVDEGHNWEGAYVGVLADYDFGKLRSGPASQNFPNSSDNESPYFGANAGINFRKGQFIVGVEADVLSGGKKSLSSCETNKICTEQFLWTSSLRGRLGVTKDKLMVFASAGVAFGRGKSTTNPPAGGTTGTDTQTFTGWTAGVGAEYAVATNIRVKAEYLYTDYGTRTLAAGTIATTAYKANPITNSLRVGVIYGF